MIYQLLFVVGLYLEFTISASNDCANIYAHCDNELFVYLKHGNDDLQLIGHSIEWKTYLQISASNITSNTMIQFKCIDSGVVGGFIATINYGGTSYSTTNPITNSNFDIMNDTSSLLVYSSKTSSPWNINTPYIANDAYWVWNGEIYNTMTFLFNFSNIALITTTEDIFTTDFTSSPTVINAHYATVFVHCDNMLKAYLSNTQQVDFKQIAEEERWEDYTKLVVTDITMNTLLRFECEDVGSIGGFIATVHYDGDTYSTTNPIEDGNFVLYSSSDDILSPLSYREKTSKPWNIDTHGIANDAYWIWNGELFNTMTFEFSFGDLLSNKICQNSINDWTIKGMEGIPQFVLNSMTADIYLDIKLESISLIEADEMNSYDAYWFNNEYKSEFYLFTDNISLALTAILTDDMYIDSEPACKNTLKWNINIETDLIVTREGVSYCIEVMSNMKDLDVERISNTSFIWNKFEFILDDNVYCENLDNESIERVDIYRIKSIDTLSICISHQLCGDSMNYSLFAKYINNDNDENDNDDNDISLDVGIGITVSIILLISLYCYYRYNRNKSVAQQIEEKGKYENKKAIEMNVVEHDEMYNDGRWYNEDIGLNNTNNTKKTEDLSYSAMNCVICLDVLFDHEESKLICGHRFHTHCIEEYNETNDQCPLCRHKIVFTDNEKP